MSGIDWSHMEVFLEVSQAQSISGAAKALGMDQSTVSRRLLAFEEQVGQTLFARSKTGVHPTALALKLLPLAHQMQQAMRQVQSATAAQGEVLRGSVRLSAPELVTQFMLIPNLPRLLEAHPGLSLTIESGGSIADMTRLGADLAIRLFRPTAGDLLAKRLAVVTLGVVGHREYLRGKAGVSGLDQLEWIGWQRQFSSYPEAKWLAQMGIEPRLRFNSMLSIIAAVQAKLGVALLGQGLSRLFDHFEVFPTPQVPQAQGTFWLLRHELHRDHPLLDVVADWITQLFHDMMP